jgi:hypothetical protein
MPSSRLRALLFSLAAAALLAGGVPARAQVVFGYGTPAAWGPYAVLPCSYDVRPWAIALPGYARIGGWSVVGWPLPVGGYGAAGRLHLH